MYILNEWKRDIDEIKVTTTALAFTILCGIGIIGYVTFFDHKLRQLFPQNLNIYYDQRIGQWIF